MKLATLPAPVFFGTLTAMDTKKHSLQVAGRVLRARVTPEVPRALMSLFGAEDSKGSFTSL